MAIFRNGKQKWVSRRAKIGARWVMKSKAILDTYWRLVMEGFKNKLKYFVGRLHVYMRESEMCTGNFKGHQGSVAFMKNHVVHLDN